MLKRKKSREYLCIQAVLLRTSSLDGCLSWRSHVGAGGGDGPDVETEEEGNKRYRESSKHTENGLDGGPWGEMLSMDCAR